ncbi:MAG: transporter [Deltaproteobacteria bacterium]|nr:transporter [Deltaproteobacteria bacterium]
MKLRSIFGILLLSILPFLFPPAGSAGETGHYTGGIEGIKLATAPPPGFYYKVYNVFYYSDQYRSYRNSQRVRPDIQNFVMVHRPIWVTNLKILGADYITTILIPITYADVSIREAKLNDKSWALGDIAVEPFCLDWHEDRWDAMFSLAAYIPTGKHSTRKIALPGKGFWTLLITLGPTLYLDDDKTWAISTLMRYELHSKKHYENIRPGQNISFDACLSKSLGRLWEIGLCGYAQWQVTDDRGKDIYYNKNIHDRVFGIGPEIGIYVPFLDLRFQFRNQIEFGARDRTEGVITNLSFTKIF